MNLIILTLEAQHFSEEIDALARENLIRDKQVLILKFFLDKNTLIRFGGILKNDNVSYDLKHPILLGIVIESLGEQSLINITWTREH